MKGAAQVWMTDQDHRIAEAFERDGARLRRFIRSRISDSSDAEDVLQEVFYELIEAFRLMKPIEQVGAWMFQVARNRITDIFRKKKFETAVDDVSHTDEQGERLDIFELLPSSDAGPEAALLRTLLLEELEEALAELPDEQREIFVAHEIEGRSFKEIARETGVAVNTLLSRKHYAVLHLRRRLQSAYDDLLRR